MSQGARPAKLVDTSVAVDHLRGTAAATAVLTAAVRAGKELVASEVVRFELLAGARDDEREPLDDFFTALSWCPVDENVSRLAGALARRYRRSHSGIAGADYLIGATALLLDADLLTMNIRHYPMFEGLRPAY